MKKIRHMDYFILVPYLILCAIGIVMVYSASAYWVQRQYGAAETKYLVQQILFVILGIGTVFFFYKMSLKILRNRWVLFYFDEYLAGVVGLFDPAWSCGQWGIGLDYDWRFSITAIRVCQNDFDFLFSAYVVIA